MVIEKEAEEIQGGLCGAHNTCAESIVHTIDLVLPRVETKKDFARKRLLDSRLHVTLEDRREHRTNAVAWSQSKMRVAGLTRGTGGHLQMRNASCSPFTLLSADQSP